MTSKNNHLKRNLDNSDDDSDAIPSPNTDEQLLRDLGSPRSLNSKKLKITDSVDVAKSLEKPSLTSRKTLKKKVTVLHTPEDGTEPPQFVEDAVIEKNYTLSPVTASTKAKRKSESKSARVKKLKKIPTQSLDIGNDGYGVLVHKLGKLSSPSPILTHNTDTTILVANPDVVENGTSNNGTEESPHSDDILTAPPPASADINQENEITGSHEIDRYVVLAMPVVQIQDSARSTEVEPVNLKAVNGVAENCLNMQGNTQLHDSARPSDLGAPAPDESNEITIGLPHTDEIAVGNATNSPSREIDGHDNSLDLTMSEMANMFDIDSSPVEDVEYPAALVNVDGYRVRQDLAATAKFILSKYGDIVSDPSHTLAFRSHILESVCVTYQKLENSTFAKLPLRELEGMCKDVGAVALLNFNVSWLVKRLEEILDAKVLLQRFTGYKDERIMSDRVISELGKELEMQKAILRKTQQKVEDFEEKLKAEKAKVEARDLALTEVKRKLLKFHKNSLVDDMRW